MSAVLNFHVTVSGYNKPKDEIFIKYTHFFLSDNEKKQGVCPTKKRLTCKRMEILNQNVKYFIVKAFNAYRMFRFYAHEKGCTNFPKL